MKLRNEKKGTERIKKAAHHPTRFPFPCPP